MNLYIYLLLGIGFVVTAWRFEWLGIGEAFTADYESKEYPWACILGELSTLIIFVIIWPILMLIQVVSFVINFLHWLVVKR